MVPGWFSEFLCTKYGKQSVAAIGAVVKESAFTRGRYHTSTNLYEILEGDRSVDPIMTNVTPRLKNDAVYFMYFIFNIYTGSDT